MLYLHVHVASFLDTLFLCGIGGAEDRLIDHIINNQSGVTSYKQKLQAIFEKKEKQKISSRSDNSSKIFKE